MELKLILQIVGFTLGSLLYLWLEYRANILSLARGAGDARRYALLPCDGALCRFRHERLLFSGKCLWVAGMAQRSQTEKGGGISRTPARRWPMIAAAYAAIHLFIYWVLVTFTNSTVPFWDSLTTSLSIVECGCFSARYSEQWFVWFVVNLVTVGLYFAT